MQVNAGKVFRIAPFKGNFVSVRSFSEKHDDHDDTVRRQGGLTGHLLSIPFTIDVLDGSFSFPTKAAAPHCWGEVRVHRLPLGSLSPDRSFETNSQDVQARLIRRLLPAQFVLVRPLFYGRPFSRNSPPFTGALSRVPLGFLFNNGRALINVCAHSEFFVFDLWESDMCDLTSGGGRERKRVREKITQIMHASLVWCQLFVFSPCFIWSSRSIPFAT